MAEDEDPDDWLKAARAAAEALDFEIPPACEAGVADNARLIADHAARVEAAI